MNPSAGLSLGNVIEFYDTLTEIRTVEQIGVLLIEQNVQFAFEFSDKVALLYQVQIENKEITLQEINKKYFEYN